MSSDMMSYCVPLMNHPVGFFVLMTRIPILFFHHGEAQGDQGPRSDHRTALLKVSQCGQCDLAEWAKSFGARSADHERALG